MLALFSWLNKWVTYMHTLILCGGDMLFCVVTIVIGLSKVQGIWNRGAWKDERACCTSYNIKTYGFIFQPGLIDYTEQKYKCNMQDFTDLQFI